MSHKAVTTKAIGQNLPYLQWVFANYAVIMALIPKLSAITSKVAAKDLDGAWAAIVDAGNSIVPILHTFPTAPAATMCTDQELTDLFSHPGVMAAGGNAKANGAIIAAILAHLPEIIAFIQAMMQFFKPAPTPVTP